MLEQTYNIRLGIGVIGFCLITVALIFREGTSAVAAFFLMIGAFLVFFRMGRKLKRHQNQLEALRGVLVRTQMRIDGIPLGKAARKTYPRPPINSTANDIDLLGPHSILSLLDETLTVESYEKLEREILTPPKTASEILARQNDVKSLIPIAGPIFKWIVRCQALNEPLSFVRLTSKLNLLESRRSIFGTLVYPALIIYLGAFLGVIAGQLDVDTFGLIWLIFALISLLSCLSHKDSFRLAQDTARDFRPFLVYIRGIEKFLKLPSNESISIEVNKSRTLSEALSIQSHPLVFLIVNSLVPWTHFFSTQYKKAIRSLVIKLPNFSKRAIHFEYNAMLALFHETMDVVFPEVRDMGQLEVEGAYHPLLLSSQRVSNDFSIGKNDRVALITGSNMSGKSTFLRTIGVNQVLAQMGAPVCAKKFSTGPFRIMSSVRISDTLSDKTSYFYAEVLRIKAIVDALNEGQKGLVLIDEIFKGTNNNERRIGATGVIEFLLKQNAVSLVTTHDLELTALSHSDSKVTNYHFSEGLSAGEYSFSYQIQKGPSPSTNALKIMKESGLPI
ncbi:MAG: hypothetical protein KDD25_08800 [Bdellovibrionales bacterium]|nr:hypothetical protein [Bdellovibrionales bacterium]